ncbi:MAG: hypothetical protein ABEH88_11885 [Halobacteriales archaeon]
MSNGEEASAVARLHDRLRATAERPVELTASRWIGEAEAVAGDLVGEGVDPEVLETRVGHVADLLENVDGTGDPEADEHVAAAREIAAELLSEG